MLTRIFHTDRNKEDAKADGARQLMKSDDGCMSTYSPRKISSSTQHPSGFPTSAGDRYEISGLTHSSLLVTRSYYFSSAFFLHALVLTTTFLTFILLCSGGLVTSKGVGMSVPDWPTTYGYNMFLFPISRWVGGVFYEHSHRLLASGIGLLTLLLAIVTFFIEKRTIVRYLAVGAVLAVISQGVLGGLRVTLYKDEIGIFHAILAQSFFGLLVIFSAMTSRRFCEGAWFGDSAAARLRWLALTGIILIYFQLVVAATMRHSHLGLSIPDFPTAYGHLLPSFSNEALAVINQNRLVQGMMPTTITQMCLQMIHRGGAVLLFGIVLLLIIRSYENFSPKYWVCRWSTLWGLLLLCQVILGAWTIWSNKAADVATAHMALGALILGTAFLFTFRLFISIKKNEGFSTK